MPYGIDVTNGTAPTGYTLPGAGASFVWVNNTGNSVNISNAGNWCNPASCTVPAASNGQPGLYQAAVLQHPNVFACAFSDTGWDTPNMPHIQLNPLPVAVANEQEKEVA
jgi:hypothetical protein